MLCLDSRNPVYKLAVICSRGGMQRQSTWRSQQFANGNKRQLPYNSGGVDDKRRRMEQTPYGSRQSSYEPRAPSLLDMSITKRMAQQMSPNSGG